MAISQFKGNYSFLNPLFVQMIGRPEQISYSPGKKKFFDLYFDYFKISIRILTNGKFEYSMLTGEEEIIHQKEFLCEDEMIEEIKNDLKRKKKIGEFKQAFHL